MTVFLAVVKSTDAPPHDFLFTFNRPCASAVWCSTLSAYQQFGQCILSAVFSLFGFRPDLFDFSLAGSLCSFLLYSAEGGGVDDSGMVVFHIVFLASSVVVDLHLFSETVGDVGFIYDRIALVSFIGEN